eukprot:gene11187-9751_t
MPVQAEDGTPAKDGQEEDDGGGDVREDGDAEVDEAGLLQELTARLPQRIANTKPF